jgi:hypothetical protein
LDGFQPSGSDRLVERLIVQFVLVGVALGEVAIDRSNWSSYVGAARLLGRRMPV